MKRGFTIIELLIVVTIIVTISGLLLVGVRNAQISARDGKRIADISQIKKFLTSYYIDPQFSKFPDSVPNNSAFCGDWEVGNRAVPGNFLKAVIDSKYATNLPLESGVINGTLCTYKYRRWTNPPCAPPGTYAFIYARCEGANCTTNETPPWCNDSCEIAECKDVAGGKDAEKILYILKEGAGDATF